MSVKIRLKLIQEKTISISNISNIVMQEQIGGFPIKTKRNGKIITLRFYPKSPDAKNPDKPVLVLQLNDGDKEKLKKIFEQ